MLALACGLLCLVTGIASSLLVGRMADRQIRADIGAEFESAAQRISDLLDRGLAERMREIQIMASLDTIANPASSMDSRRAVLRRVQETYPFYALIILISPSGRILASSSGLLEGADVSERDYFLRGRVAPVAADVHDALLMAPLLQRPASNPPRFVDLAAPVRSADGTVIGVVAAHLFWEWAEAIERDVMRPIALRHSGAKAFVFSAQGHPLLGSERSSSESLHILAPRAFDALKRGVVSGSVEEKKGDPASTLVGFSATVGHHGFQGLGWNVAVSSPTHQAFAPARELAQQVMFWGSIAAAMAVVLGWIVAGWIAYPLEALSRTAEHLKSNPSAKTAPLTRGPAEVRMLALTLRDMVDAIRSREAAFFESEARLRFATEDAGIGAWEVTGRSDVITCSSQAWKIFGYPALSGTVTIREWLDCIVPEDRRSVINSFRHAWRRQSGWATEFRITRKPQSEIRWIRVRGTIQGSGVGDAPPAYGGIIEDITEQKIGERARELLIRELDHRVKNQFAVFHSLVQFTARASADATAMANTLCGRIRALASAHDLVRDAVGEGVSRGLTDTTLENVLDAVLGPFGTSVRQEQASPDARFTLTGPGVTIAPAAAGAMALVMHELATNAVRHGALAATQGAVRVSWEVAAGPDRQQDLLLRWQEMGRAAPERDRPQKKGFGTALIRQSIEGQLGGSVAFGWAGILGLEVLITVPVQRLSS
jgi:PAS domain S-box-containing protein